MTTEEPTPTAPNETRGKAEPTGDQSSPDSAVGSGRRWKSLPRIAAATLAVVVPVSLAAFAFLRYSDAQDQLDTGRSARDAACEYAKDLTNYDFQNIDTYVSTVLAGAAGDFKDEFGKTSSELKDVIVQAKIKSENRDVRCGVETLTGEHAEVVVAMSVSISSLGTQGQPVPSQISLVASLDNVDGKWLVSKLDAPALAPIAQPAAGQTPPAK